MTAPDLATLVQFLDDPEAGEEAGLVSGLARIMTAGGPTMVPGQRHLDVPHLAVTTVTIGAFDVTHLPTGVTLVRDLDSLGHALLVLARLHVVRNAYRLDLGLTDAAAIREQFSSVDAFPVPFAMPPFGARKSIGDWLRSERAGDECQLPWERPAVLTREAVEMIAHADGRGAATLFGRHGRARRVPEATEDADQSGPSPLESLPGALPGKDNAGGEG